MFSSDLLLRRSNTALPRRKNSLASEPSAARATPSDWPCLPAGRANSLDARQVYGDLLRKIGKHPDGPSVTASIGAAGDWENKGGNVSGAVAVDEAREGLLVQEQGASGPLKLTHRTHPPVLTEAKREF